MAVVDQLLTVFARSIFAKVQAFNTLKSELTKVQSQRLKMAIVVDLRSSGGILFANGPLEVSKAALDEAKRIDPKLDLYEYTWKSQSKFDKDRQVFHWEHVDTIGEIQTACMNAGDEQVVLEILRKRLRVAWILKVEDKSLTDCGFRTKRRDPVQAYREAGIELVKKSNSATE